MPREPWECRVVAYLVQAKINGLDFDWAWACAMELHPPRLSDLVVPEPDANAPAMRLFDEQGQREESVVEAMKRFCGQAWHGECRGVACFSLDLFSHTVDETSSASVMDDYRTAA